MGAISIDDRRFKAYLDALPAKSFEAAKASFSEAVLKVHSDVANNFGKTIKSRTGLLRKSLKTRVKGSTLSTLSGSVTAGSSKVVYANLQEFGGTIKAKRAYKGVPNGPYLNIPIGENLTPAGVMRKNAKAVFNEGGFMIKSRKGRWLVMSSAGKPMFVLTKQVTIKPALGLHAARDSEITPLIRRLGALMQDAIQ